MELSLEWGGVILPMSKPKKVSITDLLNTDRNTQLLFGEGHVVFVRDPTDERPVLRDTNRDLMFNWCKDNCKGAYWVGMGFGKFELEEDAVLFRLTWS